MRVKTYKKVKKKVLTRECEISDAFGDFSKKYRYRFFYGGRGGGKSWAIARVLVMRGAVEPIKVLCAREFQKRIEHSVKHILENQIKLLKLDDYYTIMNDKILGHCGSEFFFMGFAQNPDALKGTEEVDICWVEEAASMSNKSLIVLRPTIRKPGSEIWFTFNPYKQNDPVYRFMKSQENMEGVLIRKITWANNPWFTQSLEDERLRDLKEDPALYNHIWEGECLTLTDAIIFRNKFEVLDFETPKNARFFHGIDWGFGKDPTALVRCFIKDNDLYIDKEAYSDTVTLDDLPNFMLSIPTCREWTTKADSSRPETIHFLQKRGFRIEPADKWTGSIKDGIEYLRGFNKIYIHPDCKNTFREFGMYSYKIDRINGDILPIPDDKDNHCIVKGEKITTKRGLIEIENVKVGDYVLTRKGWNKVLASVYMGKQEFITLQTNENTLKCTPEHRIFTLNKGWIYAKELQVGDKLLCHNVNVWNTTGIFGDAIQIQNEGVIEFITKKLLRKNRNICTDIFGKNITEKFLKIVIYIIKMKIIVTTPLKTWYALRLKSIGTNILLWVKDILNNVCTWIKLETKLKNGTEVNKDVKNMPVLVQWLGSLLSLLLNIVKNVIKNFILKKLVILIYFAVMPVSLNGVVRVGKITSKKCANGVKKNLQLTNIKNNDFVVKDVVQVIQEQKNVAEVYDLTVENEHEFFANGILVHNCIDAVRYALDGYIRDDDNIDTYAKIARLN